MNNVHTYDVVVVGSGIAGLSSAISAAENGARVAVLDRANDAEAGGNTRYTEAFMRMASIDEPSEDFVNRLLGDFMGHPDPGLFLETTRPADKRSAVLRGHHILDPDYVEELAQSAGPTLRWLTGHGIRFEHLPTPMLTLSAPRLSPVGGGLALVETLTEAAQELGVTFHFLTTARDLVRSTDGTVAGIRASVDGVSAEFLGQVVLACGGFEGNAEMLARYQGNGALVVRPVARGGYYNKGEGIEMALAVGAATAGNFALFHAEPVDPRSGAAEAAIFAFCHGVLVNREGERFVDEARGNVDAFYERVAREIQGQTDGIAYLILDAQGCSIPNVRTGIRTDQPPITANSLAELAVKLGLPTERLEHTVAAYNDACPTGEFDHAAPDGLATQALAPPKSNWARPLSEGPFEAYPIIASNVFTFGGLKTDAQSHVLDRDGVPIRGLYAAGEITGLYYSNYTGSTSVLRGAVFGKIAGQESARASQRTPVSV